MTFFWHFPLGNLTLTLHSEQRRSFLLRLFKTSLRASKVIRGVYHLVNHPAAQEQLTYDDLTNPLVTLYSDRHNQCSLKFETSNENIVDYGTFIRMTALVDESRYR